MSASTVRARGRWSAGASLVALVLLVVVVGLAPVGPIRAAAVDPGAGASLSSGRVTVTWGPTGNRQSWVPSGLRGVTAVATGASHDLALRSDGTVTAWGASWDPGRTEVPAGLRGVTAIAAGVYHSLALRADGTVATWGSDGYRLPRVPAGLRGVTAIAAGTSYSLALRADGTVVAWGSNEFGMTRVPAGLRGVTAIAARWSHSLALRADGTVAAWGYNRSGQTRVPAGLTGVTAIAAGNSHSLALRADGTVVAWGRDGYGQTRVPTGLTGVAAIAAGDSYSLALRRDGTVVGWGYNGDRLSRVPPGVTGISAISAGYGHVVALATTSYVPCGTKAPGTAGVTIRAGAPWYGGYGGDGGPGSEAWLDYPKGLARAGDGTLVIADTRNSRVRRVDPVTGVITTIAGTGVRGYGGDGGPATAAVLNLPRAVAVTGAGDVLIADTDNQRIRRIDQVTGVITTIAGVGRYGHGGDGGPATAARLASPQALALGADGTVYVADTRNARVRRIDPGTGIVTTIAGTGAPGDGGDGGPATAARLSLPRGLTLGPDGSLYVADAGAHRVRRVDPAGVITTVAGVGQRGCTGDGGPAADAALAAPSGLALGPEGGLYIADAANNRIRRVTPDGRITTYAGNGKRAESDVNEPQALVADPDATLLIANAGSHQITALPLRRPSR
jgi:sugar lactone lactonase YvrE